MRHQLLLVGCVLVRLAAANRASVVIYTVDPRAIEAPFNIRDNYAGLSPGQINSELNSRRRTTFFKQAGLREVADKTGGFFIGNTNDIGRGLRRVASDLDGYYLIGYRPAESTLDPKTSQRRFHVQRAANRHIPALADPCRRT